ncbi:hypothetical protein MINS_12350 [Mycolicibacterium insubricum]|uniref:Uncharacterized protein n=1 Tax=Mycolicibacterium insubricum TaxID=444597 RepID=A0A1X0CRX1_9MYCO|nr:hypothetical protein [Mycolicibacterium insubricum]MCV7083278.1 hypothetical protein [Mycolicibacterium insubricum]ORA62823.1 hypothetical protein BST26_20680 [Mycolicibacterium insubricum]BBZ65806.1 hypothetical protein MINS_12350 [Mycolicibacterium insubricum]
MASKRTRTPARPATKLRAVGPDERPDPPAEPAPPAAPKSLAEAAADGTYLELLEAQRALLAQSVLHETGQVKMTAHKELRAVAKEIETIKAAATGTATSVAAGEHDEPWDSTAL